jgi:hypothetical protein
MTIAAIQASSTAAEVVAAVNAFLSSFSREEVSGLPPSLVSLASRHVHEISQAAVELAQRDLLVVADGADAEVLKDAATVLSTAAMRLAMLSIP